MRDKERLMRISFDLDEVLFVNPETHKTEPKLPGLLGVLFQERLRADTPRLIRELRKQGFEVWVYTSSFRSERYIRGLFRCYGVQFDGVVNGIRHQKEVQGNRRETMPTKLPNRYQISLHIDDESIVATYGRSYGFEVYQIFGQDDEWCEKILERANHIRKLKGFPEPRNP